MRKILIYLFLLGNSCLPLFAQEGLENYNEGIAQIEEGNFEGAMEMLRPYMVRENFGLLSDYARFHFARAAYENRQFELAKNPLLNLMEEGKWQKDDDARYLLGLIYFQQSNPNEALQTIALIRDEEIKKEAYRATYNFLNVSSTSVLMVQFEQYPDNLGLAMALKEKLTAQSSLSSKEKEVFDQVDNMTFSDEGEEEEFERNIDQVLDIAVVLPFNYDGGRGVSGLTDNNFVVQLYQGLQMAIEEAKERGIDLNLKTFDTERSEETLKGILNDPFFKKADVIIGPIYPEETAVVAEFSERYKIPHINPLSNVNDNISQYDFSYLFRPSINSISEKVIDYCKRFEGKRLGVAYSGTTRDESLARTFIQNARRNGFEIVLDQQVDPRSIRDFFDDVNLEGQDKPKIDFMVIFSDDPNIASPTFAMVESLGSGIPVIVMDSWLYFNFASYEMMEIQDFHFVGNNTVDFKREELKEFREDFLEKFSDYPNTNAYLGYEMGTWLTELINKNNGFDFQENLNRRGFYDGILTFGFNFDRAKHNNFVPILRLDKGLLEIE